MISSQTNSNEQITQASPTNHSNFKQQLQDAVTKIQIKADLTISHSDYEPIIVSDRYLDYLQQVSVQERDRYLAIQLQQYLYGIFTGELQSKLNSIEGAEDSFESNDLTLEIINNADRWYETPFYSQLIRCNHGRGYSDANWRIVEQEAKRWRVSKNGLALYISPEEHLFDPDLKSQIGQTVSIRMPPSLIERGVYIAVGDAGSPKVELPPKSNLSIVQLYFNVDPELALLLLDRLTQQLNTSNIPFNFRTAYNEADFERSDAVVLEFMSTDWERLLPLVQTIYREHQARFQPKIPFFCKPLALGLGLAEKPRFKADIEQINLGQQHCAIIARALIDVCQDSDRSDREKLDYVHRYLSQTGIDLERLYLNLNSEASYEAEFL